MIKAILTILLTLSTCITLSVYTVIAENQKPEIKIGAILPLTGYAQSYGEEAKLALLHAIDDSKDTKFNYTVIFEDDKFSSATAASNAQKLISLDKVNVLFSNWSYGGIAVASVVSKKEVVHFGFAWDPSITKLSDNSFINAPSPKLLAEHLVKRLSKEGVKKVVIIQMQESGAEFACENIEKYAKENGIQILKRYRLNPTDISELKSVIFQIKQLGPDYIIGNLLGSQFEELFKDMKAIKFDIPIASIGQTPESVNFKTNHPSVWWSVDYSADENALNKIRARTGLRDLSGYTSYYDTMKSLIEIYETAPGNQPPSKDWLIEQLKNFRSKDGYLGAVYFTDRIRQSDKIQTFDQAAKYN